MIICRRDVFGQVSACRLRTESDTSARWWVERRTWLPSNTIRSFQTISTLSFLTTLLATAAHTHRDCPTESQLLSSRSRAQFGTMSPHPSRYPPRHRLRLGFRAPCRSGASCRPRHTRCHLHLRASVNNKTGSAVAVMRRRLRHRRQTHADGVANEGPSLVQATCPYSVWTTTSPKRVREKMTGGSRAILEWAIRRRCFGPVGTRSQTCLMGMSRRSRGTISSFRAAENYPRWCAD